MSLTPAGPSRSMHEPRMIRPSNILLSFFGLISFCIAGGSCGNLVAIALEPYGLFEGLIIGAIASFLVTRATNIARCLALLSPSRQSKRWYTNFKYNLPVICFTEHFPIVLEVTFVYCQEAAFISQKAQNFQFVE